MEDSKSSNTWKIIILLINCLILAIGSCGGPIIMRLYFIQGGTRIWFPSWLQTAGWPIILIPILISYFYRRRKAASAAASDDGLAKTKLILMNHRVFIATAVIGLLTGLDDYLYAYGLAKLPVSTSSLIIASQLAFTALFAFLIVKQKFTAYSINAVVLLTVGTGILALNGSGDRPQGESSKMYVLGFILTLGAAALYGLILPMIEKMYLKAKQAITYTLVLEIQLVMCFFATLVCTVGMVVNKDFQAIPREAREFELGETKYYLTVVWCAVIFQCFFLGAIGVIFCASSLFSGIMIAVLLPVTEILAVICFSEKFQAAKGVSLALSLWGFVSYFYGEIKQRKKETLIQVRRDESQDTQMMPVAGP